MFTKRLQFIILIDNSVSLWYNNFGNTDFIAVSPPEVGKPRKIRL